MIEPILQIGRLHLRQQLADSIISITQLVFSQCPDFPTEAHLTPNCDVMISSAVQISHHSWRENRNRSKIRYSRSEGIVGRLAYLFLWNSSVLQRNKTSFTKMMVDK